MIRKNMAGEALYEIKTQSGRTFSTAHLFASSDHDARRKAAAMCEDWWIQTGRMMVVLGVKVA